MTRRALLRLLAVLAVAPAVPAASDLSYLPRGACLRLGSGYGGTTYGGCAYGGMCECLPPGVHRFEDPIFADGFESGDTSQWPMRRGE